MGKALVGKSSLTHRFLYYNIPQDILNPTMEEIFSAIVNIEGQEYEVEVLDTAGEDDYQNMMDMWISYGEGFLLVFAINDSESFEKIKEKHDKIIKDKHGVKCPCLLVGNKQDLEKERKVTYDEAKQLADSWLIEYIETSAKTNYNCKESFEKLAQKIVIKRKLSNTKNGCPCNII